MKSGRFTSHRDSKTIRRPVGLPGINHPYASSVPKGDQTVPRFQIFPAVACSQPGRRSGQGGVTLIELLVSLGILSILLTLAIPSFTDFLISNRIVSNTNDFMATLNFARSEASKRGTFVTVCRSANASTCATDGGNDQNWSQGWIVFVDPDNSGTYSSTDALQQLLRRHEALDTNYTLKTTSANLSRRVTFGHTGINETVGAVAANFYLCANNTADANSKVITLTRTKIRVINVNTANSCG